MKHLLNLFKFSNGFPQEINEGSYSQKDDYNEEPDPPEISYKKEDSLFLNLVDFPSWDRAFLIGKPQVGGGIWVLKLDEEIPDRYLYNYYDNDNVDMEDLIGEMSAASYATDLWKERKNVIGSGVEDYEDPEGEKMLVKVDEPLREILIEELEEGLSKNYAWVPDPFNLDQKNFGIQTYNHRWQDVKKSFKRAIFNLEKASL